MPARPKGRPLTHAHIRSIGTAVPDHDIHAGFVDWARDQVDESERKLFDRMASRSAIGHRWSVLPCPPGGTSLTSPGGFYHGPVLPGTAARMDAYAAAAPELALAAIEDLEREESLVDVTHLVVASCTGFVAPGVDQIIAARLGLPASVERLLVGFMGCYAAVAALRSARHIVRSDPGARVLVVCVELSTLHLRQTSQLEPLLAMLQFGDGAAAALVTANPAGLRIEAPFVTTLPASDHLIRWTIGDSGFVMHLSGEVPSRIAETLAAPDFGAGIAPGLAWRQVDGWAVHAGGRSILDAVERGLGLSDHALDASRAVLAENGNMSSATLMFVLARILAGPPVEEGIALAFGPGLAAEGFRFATAR